MSHSHDVVVVGGGPAGCATALALRSHAPRLSVALVEASSYSAARVGETLPPPAASLLRQLGVWEAFESQSHRPAFGTVAAWGDATPRENDFFMRVQSVGWHLDRAAFDGMLASQAESRGVSVMRSVRVAGAEREEAGWLVHLGPAGAVTARFLVDATGSGSLLARRAGARDVLYDRLAGFCLFFRESLRLDPRTVVEAFADGWWYTAALPGGLRIAACMTDSDLARGAGLETPAGWMERVREAPLVAEMLRGAEPSGDVVVRTARSRRLEPAAGEGWLAVGDAACTYDPLSSQGVMKALRSGIYGAYAVGDLLTRWDDAGVRRYRAFVESEFEGYLRSRALYYAEERRWPESEFWRRRHRPGDHLDADRAPRLHHAPYQPANA